MNAFVQTRALYEPAAKDTASVPSKLAKLDPDRIGPDYLRTAGAILVGLMEDIEAAVAETSRIPYALQKRFCEEQAVFAQWTANQSPTSAEATRIAKFADYFRQRHFNSTI